MILTVTMSLLLALEFANVQKDAGGRIVAIDLTGAWITDADMEQVASIASLQRLTLAHTRITDLGFERLKRLPNVVKLDCYYAEHFTDDGIAHIKGWKKLERLSLRGTKVTSKVFEHLAGLTSLRELDLGFAQLDDSGFELLAELPKLEQLSMGGNRLTGAALQVLKLLPALRHLDVSGIQRVDSGLWGLPLTETNLGHIGALMQLVSLNLSGANISDRGADRPGHPDAERSTLTGLSKLRTLVNLEVLDLSRTPVNASGLAEIATLPKLRELKLGLAKDVDDSAIETLLAMKDLHRLLITGTALSPDARARLARP